MAIDLSNNTSIKSPDPTTSLIFFLIVTTIYAIAKYMTSKSSIDPCQESSNTNYTMLFGYIILLIIGNYFINLNVTTALCGEVQWKNTFVTTIIPWVIIFGVINLVLIIYPGWLSPFSNTIGYLIAKLMGLESTIEEILKPNLIKNEKNLSQEEKNIGEALQHIYSDKSLIINEITTTNFCIFWDNMEKAGLFKKDIPSYAKISLFNFIKLKDIIAEYIWCILSGSLVTSVGYNYIINSECTRSVKLMEKQHDNYIDKQSQLHTQNKDKKSRIYTYE